MPPFPELLGISAAAALCVTGGVFLLYAAKRAIQQGIEDWHARQYRPGRKR